MGRARGDAPVRSSATVICSAAVASHPLDALTTDEVTVAVTAAKATGRLTDAARFVTVSLHEPTRAQVDAHESGQAIDRRVHLTVVPGPQASVIEIVVAVPDGRIVEWVEQDGVRPALLFEESFNAIIALYEHPEWKAALARRGITDLDQVQVDPWPTGNFGVAAEEGRRVVRCIPYFRESPEANGYARPIEGLLARVDAARGEVIDIADFGVVPMPPDSGSYYPEDNGPIRSDLRPLEITQPDGPSFRVEGNRIEWQGWSVRVTLDPTEGLVLHDLAIRDGAADARSCGGPRSPRWSCPTATPDRSTAGRTRSTRGVGPRANGELAHPRVRLPGRDPLLRRGHGRRARPSDGHAERHLHARGGLRDPLEAPGHALRPDRGPPLTPARDLLHRDRRQL